MLIKYFYAICCFPDFAVNENKAKFDTAINISLQTATQPATKKCFPGFDKILKYRNLGFQFLPDTKAI